MVRIRLFYVTMVAGHNIVYYPGTTVLNGGNLWGYISPSNPWCVAPTAPSTPAMAGDFQLSGSSTSWQVYPNPTTGIFTLEINGEVPFTGKMEIYSMQGELIVTKLLSTARKSEFSLSENSTGIYLLRLISGNKSETKKIIKR